MEATKYYVVDLKSFKYPQKSFTCVVPPEWVHWFPSPTKNGEWTHTCHYPVVREKGPQWSCRRKMKNTSPKWEELNCSVVKAFDSFREAENYLRFYVEERFQQPLEELIRARWVFAHLP